MTLSDAAPFVLSVSLHTLEQEQGLDAMKLLNGSSVKFVELWESTFNSDESHVEESRRILAEAGVKPRTVHAKFGNSVDISSLDDAVRTAAMEAIGQAFDLAVRMGAGMVVVHPGAEPIDDDERDARLKQSKSSIETIADMARQAGCRVAIELLPRTCPGRSAEELLFLLEGADTETAGACLDTNHLMEKFDSLPEVVSTLGPRLFTLHCSDYDGVDEKHWPPLRGVIDWNAFLSALRDAGYSGPIHYEAHLDGETPAERLACLEANFSELMSGDRGQGTGVRDQ